MMAKKREIDFQALDCPGSGLQWEATMPGTSGGLRSAFLQCRNDPRNSAYWEEFLRRFAGPLQRISTRLARQYGAGALEDRLDLIQEVCLKISRSVAQIPDAALLTEESTAAYLKALTANAARDILRARFSRKRGVAVTVPLDDRLDSLVQELKWHTSERATLLAQVDQLLECPARERAVFWLYYRQGLTAREISLIPSIGLSVKGVESLLHRLTEMVRARVGPRHLRRSVGEGGD